MWSWRLGLDLKRYKDKEFRVMLVNCIHALQRSSSKDHALLLLSTLTNQTHNKVILQDMGPLLWHSFGTISILLQEVISVYRSLSDPQLEESVSNRVCSALSLLQSVATHPDTKMLLLQANIPFYVQPILNNKIKERHHEFVRVSSLGLIGALIKDGDPDVIHFIITSELFPCFLNCIEVGSLLAKTVASFIVQKFLMSEEGIKYCCGLAERFFAITQVLAKVIEQLTEAGKVVDQDNSKLLLKYVIRCYYNLSTNSRARDGLSCCLPAKLRDLSFICVLHDEQMIQVLRQLLSNVDAGHS